MNMRLAYVLFIFSLIVAFYLGVYKPADEPKTFREPQSRMGPVLEETRKGPEKTDSASHAPVPRRRPTSSPALDADAFRAKYGDHLVWLHGRSGEVIGILSKTDRLEEWQKHQKADRPFHPKNREQVLARAEQVIEDARDILQLDPEFPLSNPKLSQTDFSAQVVFDQTHQGIPLSQGKVTLLFGPEGELRGLESDYVRGVRITNPAPRAPSRGGGRPILWVARRTERSADTRYANETRQSGIQTVRDAQTGEVIYQRNRRIH